MNYRMMPLALLLVLGSFSCARVLVLTPAHVPPPEVTYEVLLCDFHIHTPHSDGRLTPVERVEEAVEFGYDVIAIADHGNFYAYEEALPRADELGLVMIRGMETGLKGREHLVALDFDADYEPRNPHQWGHEADHDTVPYTEQWPRLVREAGAFVLYAHPHVGYEEPIQWALDEGLLMGIEVKNAVVGDGWNTTHSHGTWCYPEALDFAVEHGLTVFANSDVHGERNPDDSPVTLVLAEARSPEGVMEAVRHGRTVAWFDGMLWAREEMAVKLLRNVLQVTRGEVILLENRGPAPLTAVIEGKEPVEIGPKTSARVTGLACDAPLSITWTNVWIQSDKNLQTVH